MYHFIPCSSTSRKLQSFPPVYRWGNWDSVRPNLVPGRRSWSLQLYLLCCWEVTQSCPTFEIPWTVAHQALLSMGFSRQEYWSGLPCLPPGDLPNPGIELPSLTSPALADGFFTTSATWEAHVYSVLHAHFLGRSLGIQSSETSGCMSIAWEMFHSVMAKLQKEADSGVRTQPWVIMAGRSHSENHWFKKWMLWCKWWLGLPGTRDLNGSPDLLNQNI